MISKLQVDLEDILELAMFEENITGLKEKTDYMIGTLERKIRRKHGDE
ncbi:hypothetical protein [uncultured Methanobrevibacter sp.]|nr:hypothetical protein [uncultured Methanobrevibacter sp.]